MNLRNLLVGDELPALIRSPDVRFRRLSFRLAMHVWICCCSGFGYDLHTGMYANCVPVHNIVTLVVGSKRVFLIKLAGITPFSFSAMAW